MAKHRIYPLGEPNRAVETDSDFMAAVHAIWMGWKSMVPNPLRAKCIVQETRLGD